MWLLIKNLVFTILVPGTVAVFVLLYEEPHLRRVFGDAYTRYCSGVGRWLTIPNRRRTLDRSN